MAATKLVVIAVLLACAVINGVSSLKCYKCTGAADSDCAKAVPSALAIETCTQGPMAQCFADDVRSGHERTFSRGCTKFATPDLCTLLYQLAAANPTVMKVFSCALCWDDLCNTAVTKKA